MKLKTMFMTLGLAAAVGVGVFAGVSIKSEVKEAAAATYSGRLVVKDNVGWYEGTGDDQAGKAAVYFWNGKTGGDKLEGWSKSFSLSSGTGNYYVAEYENLSFSPVNMIIVRMKNSCPAQPTDWSKQAYGNQTKDLDFADATSMNSWDDGKVVCSQWAIAGKVYTSLDSFHDPKVIFGVNTAEIVDGAPQVSGVVTLALNEEFKMVNAADNVWSGFYGCPSALNSCFTGGSKTAPENDDWNSIGNIKCLVAGTYDFFFNTETKKIWISRQDIVDADGYATYFLENVGCDASGATAPTGWTAVKNAFEALTNNDAKKFLCTATADKDGDKIARCVFWYDRALVQHPSLEKFMKYEEASVDVYRPSALIKATPSIFAGETNSNMILLVVIISAAALTAIGGYLLIKRRKQDR